jgi:hypothetical protein
MKIEGIKSTVGQESVEELRSILMHQQRREIPYDEAFHMAEDLIAFFEVLSADEASNG